MELKSMQNLRGHSLSPHYMCPNCDVFSTTVILGRHKREVHGVADRRGNKPCPVKDCTFTSNATDVKAHQILPHSRCPHGCNVNLTDLLMNKYIRQTHGIDPTRRYCAIDGCEYSTRIPSELALHMSHPHLPCPRLNCSFRSSSRFWERHMRAVHGKEPRTLVNQARVLQTPLDIEVLDIIFIENGGSWHFAGDLVQLALPHLDFRRPLTYMQPRHARIDVNRGTAALVEWHQRLNQQGYLPCEEDVRANYFAVPPPVSATAPAGAEDAPVTKQTLLEVDDTLTDKEKKERSLAATAVDKWSKEWINRHFNFCSPDIQTLAFRLAPKIKRIIADEGKELFIVNDDSRTLPFGSSFRDLWLDEVFEDPDHGKRQLYDKVVAVMLDNARHAVRAALDWLV